MNSKETRLKKRKQFNYLFKSGKYSTSEYFNLIYLKVKTKNYKIGYSISKKVGKAVVRNKVKRRLKECILKLSPFIKKEFYIIISAKPSIVNLKFDELSLKVKEMFVKNGLLNE